MTPEWKHNVPEDHFGNIIWKALKNRDPEEVIFIDAATKETMTCGRLLHQSVKLALSFKNLGIQKEDVISIVSGNNVNCFVPVLAAFYIGAAVNPINPTFLKDEMKHGLKLSKPKVVITIEKGLDVILQLRNEFPCIQHIFLMNCPSRINLPIIENDLKYLEDLISQPQDEFQLNSFHPDVYDYKEEVALVVYSSGTTGLPKGVKLTHQNIACPVCVLSHPQLGNTTKDDSTVLVPPFHQIFGPVLQLLTLFTGMKSVLMDTFEPDLFLKCIQDYKATKLYLVPPLLLFLNKNPLVRNYDLSTVKNIYIGAAPLGKEMQENAINSLKSNIKQIYGLSETSGPCTFQTNAHKTGSLGVFLPNITVKVINTTTGLEVGPMVKGEICMKGPMLMKGYIPEQKFLDEDGFLHSGDIGYYDEDNYFYIVDRIKEIIKYKAFQVAPAELENLILTHPAVDDCGVIGVPDEKAGEVAFAFVVLKEGENVEEKDIINYVAERISQHKHLHGGVRFIKEIPKIPSGKILRRKLVEIYKSPLNKTLPALY